MIHFLSDEKVTTNFIQQLEKIYPGESYYAVFGDTETMVLTASDNPNVHYYNTKSKDFKRLIKNLSQYERVFLHSLNPVPAFKHLEHSDIVVFFQGADLYELLICYKGYKIYIDEREQFAIRAANSPLGSIPIWLYRLLVWVRDTISFSRAYGILKKARAISAIDCDYSLFQKFFPKLNKPRYRIPFSLYPIEQQIGVKNIHKECVGTNIWVGNSPALNGNHTSIFKILKKFSDCTKVYVPISYGEQRLINFVERKGKEILGDKFIPLKTFLPSNLYFEHYLDANAFIFGHLRQCGYGSICMALYLGGKVFLYINNPLYKQLKCQGAIIFSIDNDLSEGFAKEPLSAFERKHNRDIVISICGSESIKNQMKQVFAK